MSSEYEYSSADIDEMLGRTYSGSYRTQSAQNDIPWGIIRGLVIEDAKSTVTAMVNRREGDVTDAEITTFFNRAVIVQVERVQRIRTELHTGVTA